MIQSAGNPEHKHMLWNVSRTSHAELFSHQEPGRGDEDVTAVDCQCGLDEMLLCSYRLSTYFFPEESCGNE